MPGRTATPPSGNLLLDAGVIFRFKLNGYPSAGPGGCCRYSKSKGLVTDEMTPGPSLPATAAGIGRIDCMRPR
jgi:hypothetical protein